MVLIPPPTAKKLKLGLLDKDSIRFLLLISLPEAPSMSTRSICGRMVAYYNASLMFELECFSLN